MLPGPTAEITDRKGPVPIQFELRDKQTVMPLGDHVAHWSSYIGEVIRGVPFYYTCWLKVTKERKAALITDIEAAHGIPRLDRDQRGHPAALAKGEHCPSRSKSAKPGKEHGHISTGIPTQFDLRPNMDSLDWTEINMQTSTTQEYPSLIETFFMAHTVNGEFLWDEDRRIYEEMRRLDHMDTYTDDEINRLARGGKQRGHIGSVDMFSHFESGGASGSGGCGDEEEGADHQDDEDKDGDGDT
nr:hypothetical protein [Tanacetum cinerariifolium]